MNGTEPKLNTTGVFPTSPPRVVLLDLGNVVLGVDFRKVFAAWAVFADVEPALIQDRWRFDRAYRQHERGTLAFSDYSRHLGELLQLELSAHEWEQGWNSIWTGPYEQVIALLPEVARRYPLYCFTNTNDSHTNYWRTHYAAPVSHFQHVFVSSEIGLRKPDLAAYQHVSEVLGTPAGDILFLDDNGENIAGAQNAGLQARQVPTEADVVAQLRLLLQ